MTSQTAGDAESMSSKPAVGCPPANEQLKLTLLALVAQCLTANHTGLSEPPFLNREQQLVALINSMN